MNEQKELLKRILAVGTYSEDNKKMLIDFDGIYDWKFNFKIDEYGTISPISFIDEVSVENLLTSFAAHWETLVQEGNEGNSLKQLIDNNNQRRKIFYLIDPYQNNGRKEFYKCYFSYLQDNKIALHIDFSHIDAYNTPAEKYAYAMLFFLYVARLSGRIPASCSFSFKFPFIWTEQIPEIQNFISTNTKGQSWELFIMRRGEEIPKSIDLNDFFFFPKEEK